MTDAGPITSSCGTSPSFTVTDEHLKLLRRANVDWDDCEFGAPAIDCKRPYGNGDVLLTSVKSSAISLSTGIRMMTAITTRRSRTTSLELHAQTGVVLQIALATGEFKPGPVCLRQVPRNWRAGPSGLTTKV